MATPKRASRVTPGNVRQAQQTALAAQSALHLTMLDLLRQMGDFTVANLTQHLRHSHPRVSQPAITQFVDATLDQFHGMLDQDGSLYRRKPEVPLTRAETMQALRDLAANTRPLPDVN